jgi:hypothetical protein
MKHRIPCLAILLCVCSLASAQTPEKPQAATPAALTVGKAGAEYHQLVERAKKGDLGVDFVRMRDLFSEWSCEDNAQTDAPNREAMIAAFEANDYAKAAELVEGVLDYEFVHLGLHRAAEDAYRKLNNQAKADFHKAVADKLLNALLTAGDGKTAATAYRVLSVREEYFIMNELGYKVTIQMLASENGKPYDILSGRDKKTDKEVSVYFDIGSFFGNCKYRKK